MAEPEREPLRDRVRGGRITDEERAALERLRDRERVPIDVASVRQQAIHDQAEANLQEIAQLVGFYRRTLIASGVPPEEAADLAFHWHEAYWRYRFYGSGA
jgi:hypothetical protein